MIANSCLVIVHTVASSLQRSPCLSINMPDQFHFARLKVRKVFDVNGVPAHSDREVYANHSAAWISHVLSNDTGTIKSYEAPAGDAHQLDPYPRESVGSFRTVAGQDFELGNRCESRRRGYRSHSYSATHILTRPSLSSSKLRTARHGAPADPSCGFGVST